MLEKDGEDQLDRSCENEEVLLGSQGGEESPAYSNTKEGQLDWSQLERENCLLKH